MRFLLLSFFLSFIQCTTIPEKTFEGILTYKITHATEDKPNDQPFGTQVIVYLKDGHMKRVYNSTQEMGIREEIFDPTTGKMFMKIGSSDTIYWADQNRNPYFDMKKMEVRNTDQKVYGQSCKILRVENIATASTGDFEFEFDFEYYFSDTIRVNPENFEKWKFGYFSKSISRMKAYYLKYIEETPATKTILEITDIEPKSLNSDIFKIDENSPIKKFEH